MGILAILKRTTPAPEPVTASDAARVLAEFRCLSDRERIRARARLMCEQQGKPVPQCLEPRG